MIHKLYEINVCEAELHELKAQQHETIKRAVYFRMTREEVEEFQARWARIRRLLEMLNRN